MSDKSDSNLTLPKPRSTSGHYELWRSWADAIEGLGCDVDEVPGILVTPNHWPLAVPSRRPAPLRAQTIARIQVGVRRFAHQRALQMFPPSPLGVQEELPANIRFDHGLFWTSPTCCPLDEAQYRYRRALMDGIGRAAR